MLILGSILVAGSILLTVLTALLFRRPDPPRWTRPDLVAMLVAVPITGVMGLGLGYMGAGIYRLTSGFDLGAVAGATAVWVVAAVIWRLLNVRPRLRAYTAAAKAGGTASRAASPAGAPHPALTTQPADPSHLHAA